MNKAAAYTPQSFLSVLMIILAAAIDHIYASAKRVILNFIDKTGEKLENGTFTLRDASYYFLAGTALYWLAVAVGIPV